MISPTWQLSPAGSSRAVQQCGAAFLIRIRGLRPHQKNFAGKAPRKTTKVHETESLEAQCN